MMSFLASWNKFDFPLQFAAIQRRIARRSSFFLSTLHLKWLLWFYGAECGKNIRADGRVIIYCTRKGMLRFGDGVIINSCFGSNLVGATNPAVLDCGGNGSITIGSRCGLSFPIISSRSGITIGSNVKIGGNVRIFDHDYHALDAAVRRTPQDTTAALTRPVVIEDDVFIGTNSIVLKGTTIGERAIIAAGSVVAGKVPPDEIWGGNPARKIRKIC